MPCTRRIWHTVVNLGAINAFGLHHFASMPTPAKHSTAVAAVASMCCSNAMVSDEMKGSCRSQRVLGGPYLAQVRAASEICDEGLGSQALIIGRVAGVHLDAGVHNGHPVLLTGMQLLHKGLHRNVMSLVPLRLMPFAARFLTCIW